MATAFLLWSSANPTVHQEPVIDSGENLPSSAGPPPVPTKPKAQKQGGGTGSSARRPPQRGLGVAQLERLRLQEHLEKFPTGDNGVRQLVPQQQYPRQIRALAPLQLPQQAAFYDIQQYARSPLDLHFSYPPYGVPGSGCYLDPPPNPAALLPGTDPNWHFHRCISPAKVAAGYVWGRPQPEVFCSMLHGQYKTDRFRTTVGVTTGDSRFLRSLGVPFQEPPSTQMRQCHVDNCEFCERKKLLFGEDPIQNPVNAGDYFDGNAIASGTFLQQATEGYGSYERKDNSMEFEFFPASSNSTATASEGLNGYVPSSRDSMAAASASGDAFCTSTSSHSSVSFVAVAAAADTPTCLDLSLKL